MDANESLPWKVYAGDIFGVEDVTKLRIFPKILPYHVKLIQNHFNTEYGLSIKLLVHEHWWVAPAYAFKKPENGQDTCIK